MPGDGIRSQGDDGCDKAGGFGVVLTGGTLATLARLSRTHGGVTGELFEVQEREALAVAAFRTRDLELGRLLLWAPLLLLAVGG